MGPKVPRSTVLSAEDETIVVAFRKHTLVSLTLARGEVPVMLALRLFLPET
jgi:hypothetical protein